MRIGPSDAAAAKFERVLVPGEIDRAARFRFAHHRQLFVVTRGALRCLLGRYLCVHPTSIGFSYGSRGKPALARAAGIEFNTAHSGILAAFAFTIGCSVGVDLEQIRPLSDLQQIASRYFCPEEAAEIIAIPASERKRAFFCCWTRKEAYLKSIGDGLSAPLDGFRITLRPDEAPHFVHIAYDTDAAKAWTLHDLRLAPDYAAALAYRDQQRSISVFRTIDSEEIIGLF
jgi:4'-phosphopantetheinyl transferase